MKQEAYGSVLFKTPLRLRIRCRWFHDSQQAAQATGIRRDRTGSYLHGSLEHDEG
jgi:hypothetical protein